MPTYSTPDGKTTFYSDKELSDKELEEAFGVVSAPPSAEGAIKSGLSKTWDWATTSLVPGLTEPTTEEWVKNPKYSATRALGMGLTTPLAIAGEALGALGLVKGASKYFKGAKPAAQAAEVVEEIPPTRLALPPASEFPPNAIYPTAVSNRIQPDFIAGSEGIVAAENAIPEFRAVTQGYQLPSRYSGYTGSAALNTEEAAEQARQAGLRYTNADLKFGETTLEPRGLEIPNRGSYELPPQKGNVTGGFEPVTNPWGESVRKTKTKVDARGNPVLDAKGNPIVETIELPQRKGQAPLGYETVPETLWPRKAQTEVLGSTGLKRFNLGPIEDEGGNIGFVSGGPEVLNEPIRPPKFTGAYTGTGIPTDEEFAASIRRLTVENAEEPLTTPSMERVSTATPTPVADTPLPAPGTINSKKFETSGAVEDIGAAKAFAGSADQVLENHPMTYGIVTEVRDKGWDPMAAARGTWIRQLGGITQGLNKSERVLMGQVVEGLIPIEQAAKRIPDIAERIAGYRAIMDDIFTKAKIARGGKLGYIEDYLTHIEKSPEEFAATMKDIFGYRMGKRAYDSMFKPKFIWGEGTGETAGIYRKGVGSITESPFTKSRSNALKDLDFDVNKIGRVYIDSMSREAYLRPAVERAKKMVEALPNSHAKELAEWYVRNVTGFDAAVGLRNAWRNSVQFMMRTTGRSILGFSGHLQALHLMRLGPVYSEIGSKYFMRGVTNMLKNPAAAYRETASLGMLPQEIYPFKFQTIDEKIDSITNFKSMIDFLDRTIAYNGFKQKYIDAGMDVENAARQALIDAKRTTFMVDPSRANYTLAQKGPGQIGPLVSQFKQVPAKIAEWLVKTAADYKANPPKARRMIALLGANVLSQAAGGPSIFHMPMSLAQFSAASLEEVRQILVHVANGDAEKALGEAALWLIPGGKSIQRQLFK